MTAKSAACSVYSLRLFKDYMRLQVCSFIVHVFKQLHSQFTVGAIVIQSCISS